MDKSTLIGLVSGVLLLVISIMMGTGAAGFVDIASLLVVLGGTMAATFINFSFEDVIGVMKVVKKVMSHTPRPAQDYIAQMVDISKKARTNGLLAIEEDLKNVDEEFLKISLQHVVNGTEPEDLKGIMRAELAIMSQRHKVGQKMFMAMGAYAPAFGMIGTLIGLVKMLQNLEDPAAVGPGMAMAMVTTFYGSVFANLFFLPMAGKLKQRSDEEIRFKEMILMGVLSVQAEESPRVIQNKLLTYLTPSQRENGIVENAEE